MKKRGRLMRVAIATFFVVLFLLLGATKASTVPLDLTTFTPDPLGGVSVDLVTGTVTFEEQAGLSAIYFFNDTFLVDPLAGFLSFNYLLTASDPDEDFLVAVIDYADYKFQLGVSGTGSFQFDLSPFQNQSISLAFGLESSDLDADSFATILNLDLATSATPVPEPGTLILMGSGLVALLGIARKKFIKNV
jgi:hypothetical protein